MLISNSRYSRKDYLFPIRIRIARIDKNLDGIRNEIKPEDAQSIL